MMECFTEYFALYKRNGKIKNKYTTIVETGIKIANSNIIVYKANNNAPSVSVRVFFTLPPLLFNFFKDILLLF